MNKMITDKALARDLLRTAYDQTSWGNAQTILAKEGDAGYKYIAHTLTARFGREKDIHEHGVESKANMLLALIGEGVPKNDPLVRLYSQDLDEERAEIKTLEGQETLVRAACETLDIRIG